jgi:hypothetical protein
VTPSTRRWSGLLAPFGLALAAAGAAAQGPGIEVEDRIDVVQVDRRLIAVRGARGGTVADLTLEVGERVLELRSQGLVGAATTTVRLLAVSAGSGGWQELRYRLAGRNSPPERLYVGDRIVLVPLAARLAGFAPDTGGWVEQQLGPSDGAVRVRVDDNVAVALSDRRAIAFAPGSGFVDVPLDANDRLESVSFRDSSAILTTPRRILIFRAGAAGWTALTRRDKP